MRRRGFCAASAALLWPAWAIGAAATPELVARIRQRLVDAPVLRGEFEQRKTLKGFKNELVSHGDFLVARERGVVWRTRLPFASTLVLTRDRLLARQADGSIATRIDAHDEPGLRAVNQMLFALMAADFDALAPRFRIIGELQGDAWRLALEPADAALAAWVARIELDGDRYMQGVRWEEARGDVSLIRFSHQQSADRLTTEEASRFD